jgi:hypothetical protein
MWWVRQLHEIPDVMSRGFIGFCVSEQWLFATVCRPCYLTIPAKSPSSTLLPICHGKERQSKIHSLPYDGSIGDIVWSLPWRAMRDLYFISDLTQPGFSSASDYRSDLGIYTAEDSFLFRHYCMVYVKSPSRKSEFTMAIRSARILQPGFQDMQEDPL